MTVTRPRAARVSVDYFQYWVAAGPDIEENGDSVPGLLSDLGPQAVAVITGLQWGTITVTAQAVPTPPSDIDPGWDVVAETDLECPEGTISVCDWAGPAHRELGELAITGPGRYRLRVHARSREKAQERSAEEHHLLIWPTTCPAHPRLLTPMDAYGRAFSGEQRQEKIPLDALDLAAAATVKRLAYLVAQPDPPPLSGERTVIHAATIAPATPRNVWNQVSNPWRWVGLGGGTNPASFDIYLNEDPWLTAVGGFVINEPLTQLAFTWSWTTTRMAETDIAEPYMIEIDQVTGETRTIIKTARSMKAVPSWTLPLEPTTVHIRLRRYEKGTTAVELEHRDLPTELAPLAQPFWEWALRELHNRLTKTTFHGYPWNR